MDVTKKIEILESEVAALHLFNCALIDTLRTVLSDKDGAELMKGARDYHQSLRARMVHDGHNAAAKRLDDAFDSLTKTSVAQLSR